MSKVLITVIMVDCKWKYRLPVVRACLYHLS